MIKKGIRNYYDPNVKVYDGSDRKFNEDDTEMREKINAFD